MGRNTKPATVRGGRVWHGGSPRETRKLNPLTEASWDLRDLKSSYWMNDAEWKNFTANAKKKQPLKTLAMRKYQLNINNIYYIYTVNLCVCIL